MLIGIFFLVQFASLFFGTLVSIAALKLAFLPLGVLMSVNRHGLDMFSRTFGKYDVEGMDHPLGLWQRSTTQQLLVGGCGLLIGVLLLYFNPVRRAVCRPIPRIEKECAVES